MADFFSWVQINWFSFFQTLGIVAGLVFTAASFHHQARAKEAENVLALNKQHRELWGGAHTRPELKRVFKVKSDLSQPVSIEEEDFLNQVIVYYEMDWKMAEAGTALSRKTLEMDIRAFFSLPLPRAVWERTKGYRNPRFVSFVTRALEADGR